MKTFFWGYFSTPWKRLLRTFSLIIIFIDLINIIDGDPDVVNLLTLIVISIPILSYIIEPFVVSKVNNPNKEETIILNLSPVSSDNEIRNNNAIKGNKSGIVNYFKFNNEYLTGLSYLSRMLIGILTSWIFGLGLFLMVASIFKRSKSLGFGNTHTIINCIFIPSALILNLVIKETERMFGSSDDILMSILPLVLGIPHLILLFKNGIRNRNGGFRV
jgi:hypothetical protein